MGRVPGQRRRRRRWRLLLRPRRREEVRPGQAQGEVACTLFATKDEELEGSPDKTDEVVAEVEALGEERSVEMDISGDSPSAVANMIGELAKQSATAATTGNPARKTAGDSTPESNPTLTLTLP